MKKVTVKAVHEEAEYFCDRHPRRRAYADLKTTAWYGSGHDMTGVEVHLCDECLERILKLVKSRFRIEPKDLPMC
jgi:hypothetical protein